MSYTPGPWNWNPQNPNRNCEPVLIGSNGVDVIDLGYSEPYEQQCGEINNPDDMRLIAAAPELLDACKSMIVAIGSTFDDLLLAKFQAIDAIKKAEGKS
jgi:hypothetical protein